MVMNIPKKKSDRLDFFKALYQEARDKCADIHEQMQKNYDQYMGDKKIDGGEDAKQVRNITYELIESQVTSYIPTPAVSPECYSTARDRNAKAIETMLVAARNKLPFERLNDLDERYSTIYGGSVWLIEWDESIRTATTVGGVKVTCLPPHRFVGQPNVFEIEDMDYCFICFETTKDELVRKYGIKEALAEEAESEDIGETDEYSATLIVCFYIGDKDCVCRFAWSGDTAMIDDDDYYARRRKVCVACGQREQLCNCEDPQIEELPADEEHISSIITRSDGNVITPYSQKVVNGVPQVEQVPVQVQMGGEMVFDTSSGFATPALQTEEQPVIEETVIPYYRPKRLPIAIRKNTSREGMLFGQSDCEVIRPQQQGINKLETRILEKLMRAGVYPVVPENFRGDIGSGIFEQVFRAAPNEASIYGRVDLQVDINRDIAQSERLYDQAKRILGISDSYQGQYDGSAQSGVAKQMQIQQAAGRLESKRRMKNAAYADIDRIIFELMLAYSDEPRPAAYKDPSGRWQEISFNRYDFVERSMVDGSYYYNDGYLFSADASSDADTNRQFIWEQTLSQFQMGAFGNPQDLATMLIYWQNMERAHYPNARENVERLEAQIAQQMQMMQQQMMQAQEQAQIAQGEADAARAEIDSRKRYEAKLNEMLEGSQ